MSENEVTDETCFIYCARGYDNGQVCSSMVKCRNCNPGEACFVPDQYLVYGVEEYGNINGEEAMKQEIAQRGPIACDIAVPEALETYTGGIFCDTTGDMNTVHVISVVGYGEENGTPYWLVRNSWGEHAGVRKVSSVSAVAQTTSLSRSTATGLHLRMSPRKSGILQLTMRKK